MPDTEQAGVATASEAEVVARQPSLVVVEPEMKDAVDVTANAAKEKQLVAHKRWHPAKH